MKRLILASALMLATGSALAAEKSSVNLSNEDAKVGYSIGFKSGKTLNQRLKTLDVDAFVAGFRDAYADKAGALTEEQIQATLTAFEQKLMEQAKADYMKAQEENNRKATAFLTENGQKADVKTTASGLQYKVLTEGTGAKPKTTDTVKVHYEGRLIDGSIFDSSVKRGEPVSFPLNQVISGWTEGLQLMSVGSKYQFTIPPTLGYGSDGNGPIPPNSVLVFDVELLSIEKAGASATPAAAGGKKKK